jgi:hypothetical protein
VIPVPFRSGLRGSKPASSTKPWMDSLESRRASDHSKYADRYDTYIKYFAFLTAGTIEYRWSEGVEANGKAPFATSGRAQEFLPDLRKEMRAFRQTRDAKDSRARISSGARMIFSTS